MKKIFLLLILNGLFHIHSNAQSSYVNEKYSLGYLATVFTGIYPTDSCLYIKGVMTDSLYRAGSFFSKVGLDGQFIWTSELIDSTKEIDAWFTKLIQNPGGNFIVSGGYLFDPEPAGFLAEYTPEGEMIRFGQFRSPYYPANQFIAVTAIMNADSNSYIVTGNLDALAKDIFLAKINANLEVVWMKTYGGNLRNRSTSLLQDTDGGIIFGGMEISNPLLSNIVCRKTITKVNSDGSNTLWEWKSPAALLPSMRGWQVNDMIQLSDGSIVGASAISKENVVNQSFSLLVRIPSLFKLKPDHSSLDWETSFSNGNYADFYHAFTRILPVTTNQGGGYVGTGSLYVSDSTASGIGIQLGVIGRAAENGDSLWMRYLYYWDDPLNQRMHDITDVAHANGGGYWMCGEAAKQVPSEPYQQGWLLYVDGYGCMVPGCQLVRVDPSIALNDKIKLYPNPASDHLTVYHGGHHFRQGQFRILDIQGRIMREWKAPAEELSTVFDLHEFVSGSYFLHYLEKGELLASKTFLVKR